MELFSHLTYHIPSDCWPNAKHTVARRSTRVILRPLGTQRFSLYWPILHNLSHCCSVGAPVVLTNPLTVLPLTTWLSLPACWCTQRTPRRRSLSEATNGETQDLNRFSRPRSHCNGSMFYIYLTWNFFTFSRTTQFFRSKFSLFWQNQKINSYPVLYMNLFYFLFYFFSYFPFSRKEENFIGPISTPDLGRWQPGLPAFRPTVNISHWTSQPKIWRTFPFTFWEVKPIFSVKFSWTWTMKVFF